MQIVKSTDIRESLLGDTIQQHKVSLHVLTWNGPNRGQNEDETEGAPKLTLRVRVTNAIITLSIQAHTPKYITSLEEEHYLEATISRQAWELQTLGGRAPGSIPTLSSWSRQSSPPVPNPRLWPHSCRKSVRNMPRTVGATGSESWDWILDTWRHSEESQKY